MRPLDVMHVFATFTTGGPQVRFATLANRFGEAARHRVVAMDGKREARALLDPAVNIAFPRLGILKSDTMGNVGRAVAHLRAQPPDLLVTSNWGSVDWAIAARLAGVPHLHMEDGFGPDERDRQKARRVWTRRVLLRNSQVLVPSRNLERIARRRWWLPRRRVHYVPNGIDLARYRNAAPAPRPPGDGPIIGTVAGLRAEKNIGRLIDAFALLRARHAARLVIVGDGPEDAALRARAAASGVSADIHFAGHTTTPEHFHAAFDIFALSSDTEQMPLSLIEAMAAGLPAAATDVGDVRDMLAAENAPFIVPREANALADALSRLVTSPETAKAIGAANSKAALARFSLETMADAHWRLWTGAGG